MGQKTRHLPATSGPIPVKSSFMLSTETANCSIIRRERSSVYIYIYMLNITAGHLAFASCSHSWGWRCLRAFVPVTCPGLCVRLQAAGALHTGEGCDAARGKESKLLPCARVRGSQRGFVTPKHQGQPPQKSPAGTAVGANGLGKAREEKTWERGKRQQNQSNPKGKTLK